MQEREILDALKAMGKITDQDIRDILGLTPERKRLIIAVHTMLCPPDDAPAFFIEDMEAEPWKQPEHKKWDNYTSLITDYTGIADETLLQNALASLTTMFQDKGMAKLMAILSNEDLFKSVVAYEEPPAFVDEPPDEHH